jgi:hypothetical protein
MRPISVPLPTVIAELPIEDGILKRSLIITAHGWPIDRPLFPFEVIGYFDPQGEPPFSGPEGFRQNGTFLHFFHWALGIEGLVIPAAQQAARAQGEGLLQVIDGRACYRGHGEPLEEDMFGTFEVKRGAMIAGSYQPSLKYRPYTEAGLFELDPVLCDRILERLSAQVAHELRRMGK